MSKFNFVRDEERSQSVAQFQGCLLDISLEPVGQFPSGKYYRRGKIEFENNEGRKMVIGCIVNEANFQKGMAVGKTYLCSAIVKDGREDILIICSHLEGAARATLADFGLDVKTIQANPLLVG